MGFLAQLGTGIAGLAGAFDPNKPQTRVLSREVGDYLGQQPAIYKSREQWLPQYAGLANKVLGSSYLGRPADSLMDLYGQAAPQMNQAYAAANPQQWATMGTLLDQSLGDLRLGGELGPSDRARLQQQYAREASRRGFGYSPVDAATSTMGFWLAGENLKAQRAGRAGQAVSIYGQFSPQAALISSILGQAGQTLPYAQQSFGEPFNPYVSDLYNTNLGAQWEYEKLLNAIRTQSAMNTAQGGAGLLSAAGFCWIAREVFGMTDPRWLEFRVWLLTQANPALRIAYFVFGRAIARFIRNKPRLKAAIRRWMERKIKS
jgi:hypothetical protein